MLVALRGSHGSVLAIMKTILTLTLLAGLALFSPADEARGFEPGQTLPDIALTDLEGKEVRFSDFLGKQYVLYGWASW